jgi:nucleoside-diphosphate kinase
VIERTCIVVKPDGVGQRRVGSVIDRLERSGLKLVALKMLHLQPARAEAFYEEHRGKPFYEPLIAFMTSGPAVAMAWEGEGAVALARRLMGATDSKKAEPGTLRQQFGTDNRFNLVHGSDSAASAARELAFYFTDDELFQYGADDWKQASASPTSAR